MKFLAIVVATLVGTASFADAGLRGIQNQDESVGRSLRVPPGGGLAAIVSGATEEVPVEEAEPAPTGAPSISSAPSISVAPSSVPSMASEFPSEFPTEESEEPTESPTDESEEPTPSPTKDPTASPSVTPS